MIDIKQNWQTPGAEEEEERCFFSKSSLPSQLVSTVFLVSDQSVFITIARDLAPLLAYFLLLCHE